MSSFSYIANADASYIDELYKAYQQDPESVDFGWRKFFEGYDFSIKYTSGNGHAAPSSNGTSKPAPATTASTSDIDRELKVRNLIQAYRSRAHLLSKTNPVRPRKDRKALLDCRVYGGKALGKVFCFHQPGKFYQHPSNTHRLDLHRYN